MVICPRICVSEWLSSGTNMLIWPSYSSARYSWNVSFSEELISSSAFFCSSRISLDSPRICRYGISSTRLLIFSMFSEISPSSVACMISSIFFFISA